MKEKRYLPIGSVVLLNNGTKKVMIIGYLGKKYISDKDKDKYECTDYVGCFYPNGISSIDLMLYFNNEDIKQECFLGYSDVESIEFLSSLKYFTILSDGFLPKQDNN